VPYQQYQQFSIDTQYSLLEIIRHQITQLNGSETDAVFSEKVSIKVKIPLSEAAAFGKFLDGYRALGRLEYTSGE